MKHWKRYPRKMKILHPDMHRKETEKDAFCVKQILHLSTWDPAIYLFHSTQTTSHPQQSYLHEQWFMDMQASICKPGRARCEIWAWETWSRVMNRIVLPLFLIHSSYFGSVLHKPSLGVSALIYRMLRKLRRTLLSQKGYSLGDQRSGCSLGTILSIQRWVLKCLWSKQ